jgi:hypothetical protein
VFAAETLPDPLSVLEVPSQPTDFSIEARQRRWVPCGLGIVATPTHAPVVPESARHRVPTAAWTVAANIGHPDSKRLIQIRVGRPARRRRRRRLRSAGLSEGVVRPGLAPRLYSAPHVERATIHGNALGYSPHRSARPSGGSARQGSAS